jgi:hypothetical protein
MKVPNAPAKSRNQLAFQGSPRAREIYNTEADYYHSFVCHLFVRDGSDNIYQA